MPAWLDFVGLTAPEIPHWGEQSGIGHLVYGGVLGAVVGITSWY